MLFVKQILRAIPYSQFFLIAWVTQTAAQERLEVEM